MVKEESERNLGVTKRGVPATIFVIFGASGDLTKRKLIPGIYNLAHDGLLPGCFEVIGVGRSSIGDEEFREESVKDIGLHSRRAFNLDVWSGVLPRMQFCEGEYGEMGTYEKIKEKVEGIEKRVGERCQLLFYISTPPAVFSDIIRNLGESGLVDWNRGEGLESKVVIEKPFGKDLSSAKELNYVLRRYFREEQIFRIDHYLGKETVQDILVQRFANSIFEPIWNFKYVSHVEITVAESLGVGSRGGYYDGSGALRDMIQNHLMQLLALVAMEPPSSTYAENIRNEKVKVLQSVQSIEFRGRVSDIVRGQYTSGLIEGEGVCGYLEEKGIREGSCTETYVGLKLSINNWRWQGVPFYIRSGKRMARRVSEVAIHFRSPPTQLFGGSLKQNALIIQLQPNEGTTLLLNSKAPGLETRIEPVKMYFKYATAFGSNTPEAYERLILDAMMGDSTLFIRSDEAEASWELFTPVLEYWGEHPKQHLNLYTAGSWGPETANDLLLRDHHYWRKPGV